jgi:hypothetical protein
VTVLLGTAAWAMPSASAWLMTVETKVVWCADVETPDPLAAFADAIPATASTAAEARPIPKPTDLRMMSS